MFTAAAIAQEYNCLDSCAAYARRYVITCKEHSAWLAPACSQSEHVELLIMRLLRLWRGRNRTITCRMSAVLDLILREATAKTCSEADVSHAQHVIVNNQF
jgi:hypothetical protein